MAKRSRNSADTMINVIIAVVLIAVIGLAAYAIYGKMSATISQKAIEAGEKEPTVEYLAQQQNMSVEDFLAMYGLEGVSPKATEEEMTDQMTVDNYITYSNIAMEDLTTQYHMDEAPAGDSNWGELRKSFTVKNYVGDEDALKQFTEIYGLEEGQITLDMPWTEAEPIIEESVKRMQEEMANATPAPATDAPEETAEAEATEEPAKSEE